jgi:hypothetical protein
VLQLALIAASALQAAPPRPRAPAVELRVDLALVRELGWVAAGASDAQALAAAAVRARREAGQAVVHLCIAPPSTGEGPRVDFTFAEGVGPDEQEVTIAWLESIGLCRFFAVLDDERAQELGIDLARERAKLAAWVQEHPGRPLAAFNARSFDQNGPCANLLWLAQRPRFPDAPAPPELARALPLEVPPPAEEFGALHFARCTPVTEDRGYPALGFELAPTRREPFGAITERNLGRPLALVLGDVVWTAPIVEDRLPGQGLVRPFESESERDALLAKLRATPSAGVFRLVPTGR